MPLILPGQEFEIETEGVVLRVKALAGKKQLELIQAITRCAELEEQDKKLEAVEATEQVLIVIFGEEEGKRLWAEVLDTEMTHDVARKVLNRGKLSEDDEKNLPSPPSSGAANSAKDAVESVVGTSQMA